MCDFANGKTPDTFLEPVLRAVILHFWLAYDHPFVDGNGRTARALFTWAMLHHDYWLAEFVSLSKELKRGPAQYYRSFLYAENDEGDLTYFLLAQLRAIRAAIDELQSYVQRKMDEARALEPLLRESATFNHRQRALLSHALRNPSAEYTVRSHGTSHSVERQTARTDLKGLEAAGFLRCIVQGRRFLFTPVANLADVLRAQTNAGQDSDGR